MDELNQLFDLLDLDDKKKIKDVVDKVFEKLKISEIKKSYYKDLSELINEYLTPIV